MTFGDVTVVVDERDDVFYTRAALQAHRPADGRITVQPTPASGRPAALAHDVLYTLGKRLVSGPDSPGTWLDSVDTAWLAAAAWSAAAGVRHVLVTRAHLLTAQRIGQLLAWREHTGVRLTLLWHQAPRGLPPALARVGHRVSSRGEFETVLAEADPIPARPFLPQPAMRPPGPARPAREQPPAPPRRTRSSPAAAGRSRMHCAGAAATAQRIQPTPAAGAAAVDAAALAVLAHPLIAGALSVLALTRTSLLGLRSVRDIDINSDITAVKTHGPGHRRCHLHAVPAWARPLLAAARTHHRLAAHPPGDSVFAPVMRAGARYLHAHAAHLSALAS